MPSISAKACACVYLKVIEEQFIKLMGSAEPDRRPAASDDLIYKLNWLRLRQRFAVSLWDEVDAARTDFWMGKCILTAAELCLNADCTFQRLVV